MGFNDRPPIVNRSSLTCLMDSRARRARPNHRWSTVRATPPTIPFSLFPAVILAVQKVSPRLWCRCVPGMTMCTCCLFAMLCNPVTPSPRTIALATSPYPPPLGTQFIRRKDATLPTSTLSVRPRTLSASFLTFTETDSVPSHTCGGHSCRSCSIRVKTALRAPSIRLSATESLDKCSAAKWSMTSCRPLV